MAQTTADVAAKPHQRLIRRSETHSASAAAAAKTTGFFRASASRAHGLDRAVVIVLIGGFFALALFRELRIHRRRGGRWPPDADQRAHLRLRHEGERGRQPVREGGHGARGNRSQAIIRSPLDQAKADLADAQATAQAGTSMCPITTVNTTTRFRSSEADVQDAEAGIAAAQQQSDAAQAQLPQAKRTT